MAMVNVVYWLTTGGLLAWSESRRPLALFLRSPREDLCSALASKYDDSTINIVQVILLLFINIITTTLTAISDATIPHVQRTTSPAVIVTIAIVS